MNKKIHTIIVDKKITDFTFEDESMCLSLGKESITISSSHDQDCCEHVYADFSVLKDFNLKSIIGKKVKDIIVKATPKMGFVLVFNLDNGTSEKVFIPCYDSQNGYYSSNLDLVIIDRNVKMFIDISGFVKSIHD